jgi:hypothetical protein
VEKEPRSPERCCHFSFIIQRNKIIEWSPNRAASPLVARGFADTAKLHAETEAWRRAKGLLDKTKDFECVNVRVKNGRLKMSAPCLCCAEFLRSCGCSAVWFSTEAGFARL